MTQPIDRAVWNEMEKSLADFAPDLELVRNQSAQQNRPAIDPLAPSLPAVNRLPHDK